VLGNWGWVAHPTGIPDPVVGYIPWTVGQGIDRYLSLVAKMANYSL
jgi:hypothetical protein